MNNLAKKRLLGNVGKIYLSTCKYCVAGKITRKPCEKVTRGEFSLQLNNYDIYGPMNMRARLYFITFIYDFIGFFLICYKS